MTVNSHDVAIFLGLLTFFAVGLWYVVRHPPRLAALLPASQEDINMATTIKDLTATVNTLRRQLDAADRRIEQIEAENIRLTQRVAELEAQLKIAPLPSLPPKPLLIISGDDMDIFQRDRASVRRAEILFHRLVHATRASITAELRRRRQDNTLYPWILISAHAGPEGILLSDGIAPPEFWHNVLDGVKVIVLATCSSSTVADELAGLVETVIWFSEDVDTQHAADFNYAFWRRMKMAANTHVVFADALREVPAVAEFVDIRTS